MKAASLKDIVQRILEKQQSERVLLLLDQFEELFTLTAGEAIHQDFLQIVLDLVFDQQFRPSPIFTLVLTLRADFLGQALAHRPLADAIQEADVKLGPMSRQELSRAITLPAEGRAQHLKQGWWRVFWMISEMNRVICRCWNLRSPRCGIRRKRGR